MNNLTFKAIEHKVNLALCMVAAGLTFNTFAAEKSMVGTK